MRRWARKNRVELCFTPTYASWANPIEAHFGPLRQFTVANSNHRNHTVQTRALHAYLLNSPRPPSPWATRDREGEEFRDAQPVTTGEWTPPASSAPA
ncbi:hypothetical protein AB0F30_30450 [Streptomyces sp. NPDC029006]|uniref:hypothetical protein n=1 Tax=Streptomyces sp. NPDC029006 TaxID=3155467 RepID=UPI00340D03C1